MTCIRCGESKKHAGAHTFRRTIDGCSFVAEVEVQTCARCGEAEVPVALMLAFDRAVAADLARRGPVSGDSFRFIRKAIPLQPIELAQMLGVSLDTVNRWETGRRDMELPAWLVVATIALETFDMPAPILPRVRSLREPRPTERVLHLANGHAKAPSSRTLRDVLAMLDAPVVLTDLDIADALGLKFAPMRARLDELAAAGLLEKREVLASGAIRWEARVHAAHLVENVRARGMDVDAPLPRLDVPVPSGPLSARVDRVVSTAWRATS